LAQVPKYDATLVSLNSEVEWPADETPYASLDLQPVSQLGARLPFVANLNRCLGRPHDRLIPQNKVRIKTPPQNIISADVAKNWIDVFYLATARAERITVTRQALARFAKGTKGCLVVLEASARSGARPDENRLFLGRSTRW